MTAELVELKRRIDASERDEDRQMARLEPVFAQIRGTTGEVRAGLRASIEAVTKEIERLALQHANLVESFKLAVVH